MQILTLGYKDFLHRQKKILYCFGHAWILPSEFPNFTFVGSNGVASVSLRDQMLLNFHVSVYIKMEIDVTIALATKK